MAEQREGPVHMGETEMKKIKDFMAHLLFILAFVFVASGMLEVCVIKLMELVGW